MQSTFNEFDKDILNNNPSKAHDNITQTPRHVCHQCGRLFWRKAALNKHIYIKVCKSEHENHVRKNFSAVASLSSRHVQPLSIAEDFDLSTFDDYRIPLVTKKEKLLTIFFFFLFFFFEQEMPHVPLEPLTSDMIDHNKPLPILPTLFEPTKKLFATISLSLYFFFF